jgi:hypothetical protein
MVLHYIYIFTIGVKKQNLELSFHRGLYFFTNITFIFVTLKVFILLN